MEVENYEFNDDDYEYEDSEDNYVDPLYLILMVPVHIMLLPWTFTKYLFGLAVWLAMTLMVYWMTCTFFLPLYIFAKPFFGDMFDQHLAEYKLEQAALKN